MATVSRLITAVDIEDDADQPADQLSFSAVLKAELADGREVVLLDDRGWGQTALIEVGGTAPSDPWASVTRRQVETTARSVVGPDEPVDGEDSDEAERAHWSSLARALGRTGVATTADELRRLPDDVVLSDRLLDRLRGR